eukprot:SAG11_NODE_6754_length_1252_cov_2.207106_1_plen_67_part_00
MQTCSGLVLDDLPEADEVDRELRDPDFTVVRLGFLRGVARQLQLSEPHLVELAALDGDVIRKGTNI